MLLIDYIKYPTIVMLTVILMGCASYQPKPIVSSDAMAAFEARTLDSHSLKNFIQKNSEDKTRIWPLTSWDLNLLTLAALYYSPDLDVARAQWGVVKTGSATAEMIPNPGLGLVTQPANTVSSISSWPLGWNLDIPIEIAGKRGYRIKQSKQFSQAALFNLYGSAWRVRSRLKTALIALYQAQENETCLKKQETSRSEMVALLERRLAEGAISFPEITQARITLAQSRLALQEAQKRQELALAQLAAAIGLPVSSLEVVNISFTGLTDVPKQENLPSSEARRQALLNRTDIRAALAEYEASQTSLQLEIAKQYPDIHLGPAYLWNQGSRMWQVGVSFSLPFFNRNEGPIAEAEARREDAAAKFNALQARAVSEVDSAWASYQATSRQLISADTLFQEQQKHQRSIVAEYNIGETDRLALAGGQLELIAAEQARLDAQVKVMQSLGLLENAIQRPLAPDVFQPVIAETNPRKEKK